MKRLYSKQSHATYFTRYHLVWIPKYRRNILVSGVDKYLKIKIKEITKWYPDIQIVELTIQKDHIHLLISFPPRYSISKIVNIIKSNTSASLRRKFKFLNKVYKEDKGIWSVGYFVSTVGIDEKTIQEYIKRQAKEDSGQAQLELI